jgi:molecular chaperone DnaK (HSP70)
MRLGIDIGTHIARAAWLDIGGRPQLVRMVGGDDYLPAVVRQTMHGLEVGAAAARALVGNAETTVCGGTRLLGRGGNLPARLLDRLPYPVREVGGEAVCNLTYAEVRAGEIYGQIVRALVDAAEALGERVDDVVLTVPASAEDRFRVQARAAAEAQGVAVRRLINQPAAALLAIADCDPQSAIYNLQSAIRVAVVNCGGGSTEVSIAERGASGVRILATAGDLLLGGDDLAWAVAAGLNERFRRTAGVDVFAVDDSRVAALGLRAAAEQALQALAVAREASLVIDHGGGFGRDLATQVRRADVDRWLAPLLAQIGDLCGQALAASRLVARQIDAVLLIGEWAYLPALREAVAHAFATPVAALHTAGAELLAVYGAALATAADAPIVWDVTPYPLGINCYYNKVELFSPIIPANTPIPTPPVGAEGAFTENYTTLYPNQTSVTLDILQYRGPRVPTTSGENRVYPHECETLGRWEFQGLHPPTGRCAPFSVTFAVDTDGILRLYAEESGTGHSLAAMVDRGIG